MKILMTADTVGGVWTYALELSRSLARRGVRVALATMGRTPTDEQRRDASCVPGLVLFESEYKLEWMQDPWEEVELAGKWLLSIERQFKPDIVHLNGYTHANLPWRVPKIVVAHSCIYSWWLAVRNGIPPDDAYGRYRDNVHAGLSAADCVIAPTYAMSSLITEIYGVRNTMVVVPNGRDATLFASAKVKEPFIFSAGRLWDEAKNIGQLDRICGELPWPVCVAGDAAEPQGAGRFQGSNVCTSLGHLNQQAFAEYLGRAAIFCLPAKYEPFGLAILEAAISGCALVLGDIPSLRELWSGAAVFVNPNNDSAMVDALRSLIADPSERSKLARRAARRASNLTPQRMATKYMGVYSSLAEGYPLPLGQEVSACG